MTDFGAAVAEMRAEFSAAELDGWSPTGSERVRVLLSAVGTIATRSVGSPILRSAAEAGGVELVVGRAHSTTGELLADRDWDLAIVLSPCKQEVTGRVDALLPAAAATGVVDTVIRIGNDTVGANTNVAGAGAALTTCLNPRRVARVVVLGSGASSRSVVAACRGWLPGATVSLLARSAAKAGALAAELGLAPGCEGGADVVVNATSWGETEQSEAEPMGIDVRSLLTPGVVLFDINNRVGDLKRQALEQGCVVVPGTLMQRFVNELRVMLAHHVSESRAGPGRPGR